MDYSVETLKEEIRVALDQNRDDGTLLAGTGDVDTLALDKIIENKIADAVRIVESNAAHYLLDGGKSFAELDVVKKGKAGQIVLPTDFMRLVAFKMTDWSYGVTTPISDDDPTYAQQHSRYGGVSGNPQRPVVAIVERPAGLTLEFFTSSGTVEYAGYIAMPKITEGSIAICEKLKPAVVYYAAYMTALGCGEKQLAEGLLSVVETLMK